MSNILSRGQINDFYHAYFIGIENIKLNNWIIIKATGDINTVWRKLDNEHDGTITMGVYYQDTLSYSSPFELTNVWNEYNDIEFNILGIDKGTYTGNQINLDFLYNGVYNSYSVRDYEEHFVSTEQTTITITKSGKIGQQIEGTISGPMVSDDKEINIEGSFSITRTR